MHTRTVSKSQITIRQICLTGILGAIAAVVMLLEVPLFFAPAFYKLDFSEVIVMIGAFALGPASGACIELIKILINLLLNGTTTAGVGEAANLLVGCSYILPAAFWYQRHKTRKNALVGLSMGTVSLTIVGSLMKLYILLPVFAKFYMGDWHAVDSFVQMGQAINPRIINVQTLVLFATLPFNLLKGLVSSLITLLLYKRLSPILHK